MGCCRGFISALAPACAAVVCLGDSALHLTCPPSPGLHVCKWKSPLDGCHCSLTYSVLGGDTVWDTGNPMQLAPCDSLEQKGP